MVVEQADHHCGADLVIVAHVMLICVVLHCIPHGVLNPVEVVRTVGKGRKLSVIESN